MPAALVNRLLKLEHAPAGGEQGAVTGLPRPGVQEIGPGAVAAYQNLKTVYA